MTDQDSNRSRDFQEEEDRLKRMSAERPVKRAGRRGRKPSKIDQKARLERSRQSARECRARKKLRYQYLEELVLLRERSIFSLREELERAWAWLDEIDAIFPEENMKLVNTDSLKCSPITGQATNKLRSLCHDLDHGIVVPSEVKKKIMKKTGEGSEADECHST